MAPLDAEGEGTQSAYREGWSSISRSMEDGVSWSGHERNVAWLNARDGTFVEASAVAGFDQVEDGRVVCRTDWDRDGDLDLWLRSRNGATLRYLENQSNPERFVEVDGLGTRTGFPLAYIHEVEGAEVRVERWVTAPFTDGYLAAPSRRVTVALPAGARQVSVAGVLWDEVSQGALEGPLRLSWGSGELRQSEAAGSRKKLDLTVGELEEAALPTRTVFRSPVPFPPDRLRAMGVPVGGAAGVPAGVTVQGNPKAPAARLLVVRSDSCSTCEAVLPDALGKLRERAAQSTSGAAPVQITEFPVTLELEGLDGDQKVSAGALREILETLLGPGTELALPLSILLDTQGHAHALYQGDLSADSVPQDAYGFVAQPIQAAFRGSWGAPPFPGEPAARWFHGSPRSFASLRTALESAGFQSDADFYAAMAVSGR